MTIANAKTKLPEALELWLTGLAEDAVDHLNEVDRLERMSPAGLNADTYQMVSIEQGFLLLYAYYTDQVDAVLEKVDDEQYSPDSLTSNIVVEKIH